ncbi:MAG: hypothetical protein ISR69_09035 [Gammaproteobacteria bacterium]|nr:hypothetical protein [Gammaproteobacteria bacterium]
MLQHTLKFIIFGLVLSFSASLYANNISQQQAANAALQVHSGRVLSIKLMAGIYKVKVLSPSGQIRVISVDANTGKTH